MNSSSCIANSSYQSLWRHKGVINMVICINLYSNTPNNSWENIKSCSIDFAFLVKFRQFWHVFLYALEIFFLWTRFSNRQNNPLDFFQLGHPTAQAAILIWPPEHYWVSIHAFRLLLLLFVTLSLQLQPLKSSLSKFWVFFFKNTSQVVLNPLYTFVTRYLFLQSSVLKCFWETTSVVIQALYTTIFVCFRPRLSRYMKCMIFLRNALQLFP